MTLDFFMQSLGWFANILFALSAAPQAYKSYKQGHSHGLSAGLLTMWFLGEGLSIIYGAYEKIPTPVMANYVFNFSCLLVICKYALFPRRSCGTETKTTKI